MSLPFLRQTDAGVEVFLYIQPRASRNKIVGLQGDALKVALAAPPVDGAANKACREFIAKSFRLPKGRVSIVSGETSRHKRLLLVDVELSTIMSYLDVLPGT